MIMCKENFRLNKSHLGGFNIVLIYNITEHFLPSHKTYKTIMKELNNY